MEERKRVGECHKEEENEGRNVDFYFFWTLTTIKLWALPSMTHSSHVPTIYILMHESNVQF